MGTKKILLVNVLVFISWIGAAQQQIVSSIPKRVYTTERINVEQVPEIDGKLDEDIWNTGNWVGDFIQREPNENTSPSQPTVFKIFYDSKYLYVGIQCYDSEPSKVNSRMSRRDGNDGDWVELVIDSYNDLRSAFSFTVTAAGVKGDKAISLNGVNEDDTWNPIWYTKSDLNDKGWSTEMKIPLSQLKFSDSPDQVWGLQVVRRFFRNEEKSVWQRIPLDAPGWVSEFGELHGLLDIKPQQQLEIQPFVVTSLKTFEKEPLNPFRDSNITTTNFGLDGKIGITNNLTLDFTVNPDFGQVEADPAAIALDGFQLFFRERRPFFIENKNILNYQFSAPIVGGSFSSDNLFYSRRIGRSPQGSVQSTEGEYVNSAERSTILGAVKFSGKTEKGLSIGIMETITSSEYAEINNNGEVRKEVIEPLSNYFVARVQKDFNNKNTFIGGIITSTYRDIDENVDFLHRSAITGGIDITHQWKNRSWYIGGSLVASQVKGSSASILRTQTSIAHLYQRVDAGHLSVDEEKTSLTGTGGDVKFGKAGGGHIKFETGLTWRSPGLELNDVGFLREADDIQNYAGMSYNSLKPFGIFRSANVIYQHWLVWDFEGNRNYADLDIQVNGNFLNNWNATFGIYSQPHTYSKSLLRGGPRLSLPDQYGSWWSLNTDSRKKLLFAISGWNKTGGDGGLYLLQNGISITYQPFNQFNLSVNPRYTAVKHRLQYNQEVSNGDEPRYITSRLDQETFSISIRLNYTINSNLSIEYYGQPFVSIGKYDDFSHVVDPLQTNQNNQLSFYNSDQIYTIESNTVYLIDEDQDGTEDYRFANPDFSFAQFRSNLVMRYEYKPGSEIFLVWSQGITDYSTTQSGLASSFREQIFSKQPENTFLIKATYRFVK